MQLKIQKKRFYFLGNCIRISCGKFEILKKEYLSSGVNVLTNSPKIWHVIKEDYFQLKFSQRH